MEELTNELSAVEFFYFCFGFSWTDHGLNIVISVDNPATKMNFQCSCPTILSWKVSMFNIFSLELFWERKVIHIYLGKNVNSFLLPKITDFLSCILCSVCYFIGNCFDGLYPRKKGKLLMYRILEHFLGVSILWLEDWPIFQENWIVQFPECCRGGKRISPSLLWFIGWDLM